jgi:hypothetical protein
VNGEHDSRCKRRWRLAVPATLCLLAAGLLGCNPAAESEKSSVGLRPSRCVEHDGLPDKRCTPGAIRAGVPLATICAFGYSRSVRPPESLTEPLKLAQMRAYRLPGFPSDYEEDHLVPLSIGGAPRDPQPLAPAAHRPQQRRAKGPA